MSNKNADKMRTAVVHPTEQIGKLEKDFLEKLRDGLSNSIQQECNIVHEAAHVAIEKAARVPGALNLNQQTLKVAVKELGEAVKTLNTLNNEARQNKVSQILEKAGVIQTPSNKGPGR